MTKQIPWLRVFVEGVVIVGSILLAFGLQAWWDDSTERGEEREVLGQLASALELDRRRLTSAHSRQQTIAEQIGTLLDHLESGESYTSALGLSFGAVGRWVGPASNAAAYESLKSRGFSLIEDEALRLSLITFYEDHVPRIRASSDADQAFVAEHVYPYFLRNFRYPDRSLGQVPIDYGSLRRDPYYGNLLVTKLNRVENRIIPNYERALVAVDELLQTIARHLEQ